MADDLAGDGKNKVFVAGLPWKTTQEELYELLKPCGRVVEAKIILDRETGRSKGTAFVEMSNASEAQAVIQRVTGYELGGRTLFAAEFKPKAGPGEAGRRPPMPSAPRSVPGPPLGVERRSGQDRRKNAEPGGPSPERREFKKPWVKKPWSKGKPGFGEGRPWEKKPWSRDKPGAGEGKPWEKKPWSKEKPGASEGKPWEKKPWSKEKPGAGGGKPWDKGKGRGDAKPWGKKPFAKRPFAKKPGGFRRPGR